MWPWSASSVSLTPSSYKTYLQKLVKICGFSTLIFRSLPSSNCSANFSYQASIKSCLSSCASSANSCAQGTTFCSRSSWSRPLTRLKSGAWWRMYLMNSLRVSLTLHAHLGAGAYSPCSAASYSASTSWTTAGRVFAAFASLTTISVVTPLVGPFPVMAELLVSSD